MHLFVNDLTVIDFSYLCEKRGIVGESWIVDLVLIGDLDHQSMVLDFGKVKKRIKSIIDGSVDHKLAVATNSDTTTITKLDKGTKVEFPFGDNLYTSVYSPDSAFAMINAEAIDMECVKAFLIEVINPHLPGNVSAIDIKLRAEAINGFYYHYTHGLKKHDGNCQRIAHGHRSKIQVQQDDMYAPKWQKYWSDRFEDIYIGSEEDIVSPEQLDYLTAPDSHPDLIAFKYEADQGEYELVISNNVVEVVPCDSTVECLAQYMAEELKAQVPDSSFTITAYEGVGKGAIAFS